MKIFGEIKVAVVVALFLVLSVGLVQAQSALSGTVIQVRQLGDTVFAEVDTDRDGVADIQVKLEGRDTVLDENGNPVALGSLAAGSQITIPAYRYDSQNDEFDAKETSKSSDSSVKDSNDNATDSSNDSGGNSNDGNDASNDHGQDRNDSNDGNDHNGSNDNSNDGNDGNDNNNDDNNDNNDDND